MKILIINGPNLNLVGKREEKFYGMESFDTTLANLRTNFSEMELEYMQSNSEGDIVTAIQGMNDKGYHGLVINPAAYSHYSIAIHDALLMLNMPKIEVHYSNIHARDPFRRSTITGEACDGIITGLGKEGYRLALEFFRGQIRNKVGFKKN